ncbi:hypothetical protein ACFV5G_30065 [Streptomyces sp. NPDC059766]|uniref:hypothetical protein n=1 Tax=Streptomyces sp. NPDC059766 TaxID=3346940 RepID=UPI00365B1D4C
MLARLWEAAGSPRGAEQQLGIAPSTFRGWRSGRNAPSLKRPDDFWSVLRKLQLLAAVPLYTDSEWDAALRAAQAEGIQKQHGQTARLWEKDEHRRFVQPHEPAAQAHVPDIQGRKAERAAMNAFVRSSASGAPSYLCWQADAPVGKTVLLADYVLRPPQGIDILNFFVSATHSINTRAEFEKHMAAQIGALLRSPEACAPHGIRQWRQLFATAAERSAQHGRKLVLVVDGLDDDVAWSGPSMKNSSARGAVDGSIAALLPASPRAGMRVIVSLRRWTGFPKDVSEGHPLCARQHVRTLTPVQGVPQTRQIPSPATDLGATVTGLLAVAGGGLRARDMAELTGAGVDCIDRLIQGPQGRAFVMDDPALQTYTLPGSDFVREVREGLGAEGLARHTRTLLSWSQRWQAQAWPDETPPYPLMHQLRLLTDTTDRAAYLLDLHRLHRLASTDGLGAALAQLDVLEGEIGANGGGTAPDTLALLAAVAATRTLLHGQAREVPCGAPALFVRLGEGQRALDVARSAATAAAKAVHLADAAVEMAYAGHEGADSVAQEAAGWLLRSGQDSPGIHQDPATYTQLLEAAHTLVELDRPGAARPLLRTVVGDQAAGIEALTKAARVLVTAQDSDITAALRERAEILSQGSTRARSAAVELWGALARAVPTCSSAAGDHIEAICEELTPEDGLAAVDVRAVAASALFHLPAARRLRAQQQTQEALAHLTEALADPDQLSHSDQAHLSRELTATLARLVQAVYDTQSPRNAPARVQRLLASLPQHLRTGALGDVIPERAQAIAEAGEESAAQADRNAAAAAREKENAYRRYKDAERKQLKAVHKRARSRQTDPVTPPSPSRPAPVARRTRSHRPSTGLPLSGDSPQSEHIRLLQEADDHLSSGDLQRSRELLESALRHSPAPSSRPALPEDWTITLSQALGTAGEFATAEVIAEALPATPDRIRHLAALSLGASLGGHQAAANRPAREAARLLSGDCPPAVRNLVAQALAHTGDGPAALAAIAGGATQKRHALTAVAAGLARSCPSAAARIAEPLTESLAQRIDEASPLRVLPDLAALLLAYPDVRQPDPRLRQALRRAALPSAHTSPSWPASSMTVLTVLQHLGHLPEETTLLLANMTTRQQHSAQPEQAAATHLALLCALTGDTTTLRRHAEAAPTPHERAAALATAATHLAGIPVAPLTNHRADHKVVRTCLALAHASADNNPPAEATARHFTHELLTTGHWTHTIELLPHLAPKALKRLSLIAADSLSNR